MARTTYTAFAIHSNDTTHTIGEPYSRKEYATAAADKWAEENYGRAMVITSSGKRVHWADRTRQSALVRVELAGRVARKLGITGEQIAYAGHGSRIAVELHRGQARNLAKAIKDSGLKASTVARHLARIDAALAA